ncbi:MAG: hypothetical protein KDC34_13210 [Saprospiraceae bacterium]|nr:hypothetical protein [Saprospiraceae bacterium]
MANLLVFTGFLPACQQLQSTAQLIAIESQRKEIMLTIATDHEADDGPVGHDDTGKQTSDGYDASKRNNK